MNDGGDVSQATRDRMTAALEAADGGAKGYTISVLEQTCGEAFGDRLLLATCAARVAAFHYYSFEVLSTDIEMRDCLKDQHGRWTELPHDSDDYLRARGRYNANQALRAANRQLRGK